MARVSALLQSFACLWKFSLCKIKAEPMKNFVWFNFHNSSSRSYFLKYLENQYRHFNRSVTSANYYTKKRTMQKLSWLKASHESLTKAFRIILRIFSKLTTQFLERPSFANRKRISVEYFFKFLSESFSMTLWSKQSQRKYWQKFMDGEDSSRLDKDVNDASRCFRLSANFGSFKQKRPFKSSFQIFRHH